jgi:hypothetical protein
LQEADDRVLDDGGGLAILGGVGVMLGLWLLARGMGGYRRAGRIGGTSTSTISTAAAGEVRISGTVEPAELILTSPLQSAACVYYRSRIEESDVARGPSGLGEGLFDDERAIAFRVRDASGSVRVFPRGARFDVPDRFDERSGSPGDDPPGLMLRTGDAIGLAQPSREALIERLLTVRPPASDGAPAGLGLSTGYSDRRVRYREARIEPGDTVTVIGGLMPFGDLPDPLGASDVTAALDPLSALSDPIIAADLAEARAAGQLAPDPVEAWGNAAIPGFGIGQPVRSPELDPAAHPAELAAPGAEARNEALFEIAPDHLVLAAAPESPLLIAVGTPGAAVQRQERSFLVGLLGAILAIASAFVVALALSGTLAS